MRVLFGAMISAISLLSSIVCLAATDAEQLLQARNAEFQQEIIKVAPNVYTAVGFGVSPTSMIVGETGVVIIDTQIDATTAKAVLAEFGKITDKPVSGIILTHGHGDHTGGVGIFAGAGKDVQIWAREGFNQEARHLANAGLTIARARGHVKAASCSRLNRESTMALRRHFSRSALARSLQLCDSRYALSRCSGLD